MSHVYSNTDLLTWVGGRAYPTVDSFVGEARLQGCSRRLPGMLNWVSPGKTRIFLGHKHDNLDDACGVIFGYYTLNSIHHIYNDLELMSGETGQAYQPVLRTGRKPPSDIEEFEDFILRRKVVVVRREAAPSGDPLAEWFQELWQDWLVERVNPARTQRGVRRIPLSLEADNLERLCGGASNLGSGRFEGAYASDDLGDWLLDQIIDWLTEDDEFDILDDDYFWEEVVEEEITVRRRVKHKKAPQGTSRSGRVSLKKIHQRSGEPPSELTGLVVFKEPYPRYYNPPKAASRGFQRIDGNALLLKVNLPQHLSPEVRTLSLAQ
jgi:hypothetical protein